MSRNCLFVAIIVVLYTLCISASISSVYTSKSYCYDPSSSVCSLTFVLGSSSTFAAVVNDWFSSVDSVTAGSSTSECVISGSQLSISNTALKHVVFCTFVKKLNTFVPSATLTNSVVLPAVTYFPNSFVFTDKTTQGICTNSSSSDSCVFTLTIPASLTSLTFNTTSQLSLNAVNTPLYSLITFSSVNSYDDLYFTYSLQLTSTTISSSSSSYQIGLTATKAPISPYFFIYDTSSLSLISQLSTVLYSDIRVYPYPTDCTDPYTTTCTMIYVLDKQTSINLLHFAFDTTILSSTAATPMYSCPNDVYSTIPNATIISNDLYMFYCQVWQKAVRYYNNSESSEYTNGQASFNGQYIATGSVDVYFNTSNIINYIAPLQITSQDDCIDGASPYCTITFATGNYHGPASQAVLNQLPFSQTIDVIECSEGLAWNTYKKSFSFSNTITAARTTALSNTQQAYTFNQLSCNLSFVIDPSLNYSLSQHQIMLSTLTTTKSAQTTTLYQTNTTLDDPVYQPAFTLNYNYTLCSDIWSYSCTVELAIVYQEGIPLTNFSIYLPGSTSNYDGIWDQTVTFDNVNTGYANPTITASYHNSLGNFALVWNAYSSTSTQDIFQDVSQPIRITITYRLSVNYAADETAFPQLTNIGGVWLSTPQSLTTVNTTMDLEGNALNGIAPTLDITFAPLVQVWSQDDCADLSARVCSFVINFTATNPIAALAFTTDANSVYGLASTTAEWVSADLFHNILVFAPGIYSHLIQVHKPFDKLDWSLVISAEWCNGTDGTYYYFNPNWGLKLPLVWTTEATPSFSGCDDPAYPYCDVTYDIVNSYYPGENWYPLTDGPVIMHEFPDATAVNTTLNTYVMLNCMNATVGYTATSSDVFFDMFLLAAYALDPTVDDTVPPASCTVRWQKLPSSTAPPTPLQVYMMAIVPLEGEVMSEIGTIDYDIHWPAINYRPLSMTLQNDCFTSIPGTATCSMNVIFPASTLSPLGAMSSAINQIPADFPFLPDQTYRCIIPGTTQTVANLYVEESTATQNVALLLITFPSGIQTTTRTCTVTFTMPWDTPVLTTGFLLPFIRYQTIPSMYSLIVPSPPDLPSEEDSTTTTSQMLYLYDTFIAATPTITDASVYIAPIVSGGIITIQSNVISYNSSQFIDITYTFLLSGILSMNIQSNFNLDNTAAIQCISSDGTLVGSITNTLQKTTLLTFSNTTNGSTVNQTCTAALPFNHLYPTTTYNVTHNFVIISPDLGTSATYYASGTYPYYVSTAQVRAPSTTTTTTTTTS